MLIGISGKKRIGKDTCGHYLELKHGFCRIGFADALKRYARKFGWDGKKDEKGRQFLQDLGMIVRAYDEHFWANEVFRQITKATKGGQADFVITDVRFHNEVAAIKELGGIIIRLWGKHEITNDPHPSETELDTMITPDYKVESVLSDFNGLYRQLDAILEKEHSKTVNGSDAVTVKAEQQLELNFKGGE